MAAKVKINRAPVLTLWASVVAERLGYDPDTALTLGKVLAGLNAQSKGQRLGIYEPSEGTSAKEDSDRKSTAKTEPEAVRLLGRQVPVQATDQGLRAEDQGKAVDPKAVERYLQQKFKDQLPQVRQAMQALAQSMDQDALERRAYDLYEEFRPDVPEGKRGWGAAGELDLDKIQRMAEKQ
jgi:hypothetical protein